MPILDVTFHAVPDILISGEVVRTVLQITNQGQRNMKKLAVKVSHASFLRFGHPDQVECAPYGKILF